MIRIGWWVLPRAVALSLLIASTACTQVVIESEVLPEVGEIAPYEYPYAGLKVAVDPKGYREFSYRVLPENGIDANLGVLEAEWRRVGPSLTLAFTPAAHREWHLTLAFRHPDGRTANVNKSFSVALPPWHASGEPVEFTVNAGYACLWSESLEHMVNVKTLIGYKLELVDLPADLDRSVYNGFAATAPSIRHLFQGAEQVVNGVGGGAVPGFGIHLWFAGNYQLGVDPYPRCQELERTLDVADWSTSQIRLIDKYRFPVAATAGRVLHSRRVPKSELAPKDEVSGAAPQRATGKAD